MSSPYSNGLASAIAENYFEALQAHNPNIIKFYSSSALLSWGNKKFNKHEEISNFFACFPNFRYKIYMLECQSMLSCPQFNMITCSGYIKFENEAQKNFHSTFYIEVKPNGKTALIRSHILNYI